MGKQSGTGSDTSTPLGAKGKDEPVKKKKWRKSLVKAVKPSNLQEERQTFMKKQFEYNPQFTYIHPIDTEFHPKFGYVSSKYLPEAIHILKTTLARFGSYEEFARVSGGNVMSLGTLKQRIQDYIEIEGLEEQIDVVVSEHCVSRGCLTKIGKARHRLTVKPDIREGWIDGLLRHEVGTHYMRSFNNSQHPWNSKRKRKRFKLLPLNPTEEGLASLHTILFRKSPSLWRAALLYYTAYMASKMSFCRLFHNLERFVLDPEVRFDFCLRSKRGLTDTSKPGAFCKDQVYLQGVLEILKNRSLIDFQQLMKLGKISYRDITKLSGLTVTTATILPSFMEDMQTYHKRLEYIIRFNGLANFV